MPQNCISTYAKFRHRYKKTNKFIRKHRFIALFYDPIKISTTAII